VVICGGIKGTLLKNDLFEWDDEKALANQRKHNVSFEEAMTIFEDALSVTQRDLVSSDFEERFTTIGLSLISRVLLVVHTDRGERIRIISARKATPSERIAYEEQT
jgi:uncharacterized DUF497 family protein